MEVGKLRNNDFTRRADDNGFQQLLLIKKHQRITTHGNLQTKIFDD